MKFYLEMMKKPVFTIVDVAAVYDNIDTGKNYVSLLQKSGQIDRIRKNMYTCISPETGLPIANKFQIASAISKTSFVSHHSALAYYGVTDQVYYDVYVASKTRFKEFEYDGYTYRCIITNLLNGVIEPTLSKGIRVSDLERTVIDSIKDFDKVSGIEEVLAAIELLPQLNELSLLKYLEDYNNQFLYQKTGFVLSHYNKQFGLSDRFFEKCRNMSGKSKRYFAKDTGCMVWNTDWKMMVPANLFDLKN